MMFPFALAALLSACGGGGGGGNNTNNNNNGACNNCPNGNNAIVFATVAGTVTDRSGAPVSGVTISVFHHNENKTATTTTDANGAYAVGGLATLVNADYEVYAAKPGLGFLASVSDTAGAVTTFDFNGLYRTVIRFITMPAHDVRSANFTALRAGDKIVSLARSGQTQSFASGDDFAMASASNALWAVRSGSGAGVIQLLATGVYDGQGGHSFGPRDDANLQVGAVLSSARFIDNGGMACTRPTPASMGR